MTCHVLRDINGNDNTPIALLPRLLDAVSQVETHESGQPLR